MIHSNMLKTLLWILPFTLLSCESANFTSEVKLKPKIKEVAPKKVYTTETGAVKSGEGLFQALRSVSIHDNVLALQLINALRDEVEFSKLKVGDLLEATFDENKKLVSFSFSQNPAEKHVVTLNPDTKAWDYSFKEEETFWHTRMLEGSLQAGSTLQNDLISQELSRPVIAEVINVLLCKVNFRFNARMGDKYKVLLKERMFQDKVIETKVLYTSYSGVRAGTSEAFYFEDKEKGSTYTAHYTEDGEALISSGLRYPLPRLHIRSGYGLRTHPVTGRRVMHRGVDLRGRTGDPVHAVASGKVVSSNFNIFGGNRVAIRHRDGSISYYLHLNSRAVKKGDWVKSYQVIGRVGATGRVTGPHLHFGFKQANGRWMNPMNKRMIATPKLQGERFLRLSEQVRTSRALIDSLEISKVAKYILADIPNQKEESFIDVLHAGGRNLFDEPQTESL